MTNQPGTTNTKDTTMPTALQTALKQANGRRRTRTLTIEDITEAAELLKPGEHAFIHGGHVANAYSYAAVATGAVVWKPKGKRRVYVELREVNATRGSTGFGREDRWTPPESGDFPCITKEDTATAATA